MNTATLFDRLDGVRQMREGRWMAKCPSHPDKSPSLAVTEADDRILIYCHAGCSVESVLSAAGLTFQDLYRDPWKAAHMAAVSLSAKDLRIPPRKFDDLDHEKLIVDMAEAQIKDGHPLSLEDQARVRLAIDRIETAGRAAA